MALSRSPSCAERAAVSRSRPRSSRSSMRGSGDGGGDALPSPVPLGGTADGEPSKRPAGGAVAAAAAVELSRKHRSKGCSAEPTGGRCVGETGRELG
eukprot:167734-Chlamydomonas_euryale.AAC.1